MNYPDKIELVLTYKHDSNDTEIFTEKVDAEIEESGFSVVHVVLWKFESKSRIISALNDFGCGVNTHVADNYLVISIPPQVLYQPLRSFLLSELSIENIDFRESLSGVHTSNT